jgi:hypothetical protein
VLRNKEALASFFAFTFAEKQRNRAGDKYRWFCSVFAQAQAEAYATTT